MAQFVSRGGPSVPSGVVTVAELLRRNVPVPRPAPDDCGPSAAEAIPVGALLRREGRAPHALDRPVRPRGARQAGDDEIPAAAPLIVRRGIAAAGALLAVGAVFGAAVVTDGTGRLEAAIDGALPGLDGAYAAEPGGATAPLDGFGGAAGALGAVDAATGAPVGVAPAAFSTGSGTRLPGLVGQTTTVATRPAPAPAPAAAPPATTRPVPPPAAGPGPAAPAPPAPAAEPAGPVERLGGAVQDTGGAVGDVVRDAPGALTGGSDPGPTTRTATPDEPEREPALSSLTEPLGRTAGGVGRTAAGLLGG